MSDFSMLRSEVDASTNFVWEVGKGQALEARYVRRHPEYVACYLSTQTACAQACRMCHLTFTGQNKPRDATHEEVLEQARTVMDYYVDNTEPAKKVHYNFMARGEPLASELILDDSQELFLHLGAMAKECGVAPRFLISTIMPEGTTSLVETFPTVHPEIYYSLYSMDPEFRRRWLPRAMDPEQALDMLVEWQYHTKKVVKIHFALIEGLNDSRAGALEIAHQVNKRKLRVDYAIVRYNPPSEKHGQEPSERIALDFSYMLEDNTPGARLKQVDRVGPDVAASCGMFVNT